MRSIGRKLFVAIALPTALVALLGVTFVWRQTDLAVRDESRRQAMGLAEFIATSFGTVERTPPGTTARVAHRSVTAIVRSDWSGLKVASEIRIVDQAGLVRWSRRIEEEDKSFGDAARVKDITQGQATFTTPPTFWPWGKGGGGEVLYPLGGVSCGGCHTGDSTLRTGVLQLTVEEPSLRRQVSEVFASALWSVLVFTIALVAAVALSLRLVLTQKLKRLARVMQRAEGGDLVVRAPDLGNDEIGSLANSFNRMLAKITELKVTEIDTQRDLDRTRAELQLKTELGTANTRLATRVDELEVLFEIARTIASTLELNEVLQRIASMLPPRLKVDRFSVMLLNQDAKLEVLQSLRPLSGPSVDASVVRGQYAAGERDGKPLRAYVDEEGVAAGSRTETFVALQVFIDNWRWAGVPFFLRTGKRLPARSSEITIQLKEVPPILFNTQRTLEPNVLTIRLQPDEGFSLCISSKVPGPQVVVQPVPMDFSYCDFFKTSSPEAYERLLLDVLAGDATLFMRRDSVEASWRWLTPVLERWSAQGDGPLPTYRAGEWGPADAAALIERTGRRWRTL